MKIKKFNEDIMCVVSQEDLDYAKSENELPVLNYLKMLGDDMCNFKSEYYNVKSCEINFGGYEVVLKLNKVKNCYVLELSKQFNNFCEKNTWCDKNTLSNDSYNEGSKNEYETIMWDSTVPINIGSDDGFLSAFTDFDEYDDVYYVTVKLDG